MAVTFDALSVADWIRFIKWSTIQYHSPYSRWDKHDIKEVTNLAEEMGDDHIVKVARDLFLATIAKFEEERGDG